MISENIVLGILAHVDAGKTTLTEALLYKTGAIRKMGRVDHRDSWFDSHEIERRRGITVFSKQNPFVLASKNFTLIDTHGHVDFSAEMERTLQVLDCAVLVIDGVSGVQAHSETVWNLLAEYGIPTFVFINKCDREQADKGGVLAQLKRKFSGFCLDFTGKNEETLDEIAMLSEELMELRLSENYGEKWESGIGAAVADRKLFPCVFGSALTGDGVDRLLEIVGQYSKYKEYPAEFSARAYKIMQDGKGNRLTFLKITGGELRAKDTVGTEKIEQIKIFSGEKSESVQRIGAGGVCAVAGLNESFSGCEIKGAGISAAEKPKLNPMLTASVILPQGCDLNGAVRNLRLIEEELPEIAVSLRKVNGEESIHIKVMGRIQLEVLREIAAERFGLDIDFGPCRIIYKETVAESVIGYGHYEPLRHYAEVHLRLDPLPRDSGIQIANECSLEMLGANFQHLALTHIGEKKHLGILTGSELTDVKITLIAGRSHLKHTEGGDFREATYRAVRQALEKAENILLEPYYAFVLRVPKDCVGRAISDIQRLCGEFEPVEGDAFEAVIKGSGPVSEFIDYPESVIAYTKGKGSISFFENGYRPCHNAEEITENIGYIKERDLENPSSSVFCSHGAGFEVKWQDVDGMRHIK